jgi:hypothetical protein
MLLSIGDQIRPGTYRFHSRFDRAVNFERGGRLIAVVDESIGPGPLNIVLRGLKLAEVQALAASSPSILKGLSYSAQGWIVGAQGGGPTLGKRPRKPPNPEGVASRLSAGTLPPLRVSPTTVLFAGHCYHFTANDRYNSTLDLARTFHTPVAADVSRRTLSVPKMAPTNVGGWNLLTDSAKCGLSGSEVATLRRFLRNLSVLGESLKADAPPKSLAFLLDGNRRQNFRPGFERSFVTQITLGVRQVFHGPLLPGIRQLKGCGLGLTPAGDDFIAGFLIGLHLLSKLRGQDSQSTADAVFRAARGKNIFSNTFLDLANRGMLFGHLKDLLLALITGSEASVRKATRKLFAIGETSGADLATGFFMTLQNQQGAGKR